jgi:hypothetical protein
MPPSWTLVSYNRTHLILSSCCIEDWAFHSSREFTYFYLLYALYFYCKLYTWKHQNYYFIIIIIAFLSILLTNTFSSTWVRQLFLLKSTTIDLLHFGAISHLASSAVHLEGGRRAAPSCIRAEGELTNTCMREHAGDVAPAATKIGWRRRRHALACQLTTSGNQNQENYHFPKFQTW